MCVKSWSILEVELNPGEDAVAMFPKQEIAMCLRQLGMSAQGSKKELVSRLVASGRVKIDASLGLKQ